MDLSLEGIRHRSSVRSFDGQPLSPAEGLALETAFEECVPGPFGGRARFVLVSAGAAGLGRDEGGENSRSGKIGTYGLVTKVPAFIVGAISKAPKALEDFGYSLEGLVLRASDLGLDSCWIGGVFGRSAAAKALALGSDELMPAVIALGRAAEKPTVAEYLTRRTARAGTRKPFGLLFSEGEFGRPLAPTEPWYEVLEALRIGPSASNKQPWRMVRTGGDAAPSFHLYLEEDRLYNSVLGEVHIQNVDMGIAMRHFEAAARILGLPGAWRLLESGFPSAPPRCSYIATWVT